MVIFVLLLLYILVLVGIGRWTSRGESKEGFLIADRKIGFWRMFLSRAAGTIGAGTFITLGAYAYQFGMSVYAYVAGIAVGYIFFAFYAVPKIVAYAREQHFYTIGDFIYSRLQHVRSKKISDILVAIISAIWGFSQVVMGALLISYFGNISYIFALLLTGVVVSLYLILGGFKAILATDVLQVIMIVCLGIIIGYIFSTHTNVVFASVQFDHMEIAVVIGFFLYGIFEPYANGNMYQMCYAAKDMKTARKGIMIGWVPAAIIASVVLLVGFAVRGQFPGIDPQLTFLIGVENFLTPFWISMTIIIMFASLMSTLDSTIYASASHIAFLLPKEKMDKVVLVRWLIAGLLTIMVVMGIFINNVVDITIIVAATTAGLLSPAIASLLAGNKQVKSFLWSIALGVIGMVVGILLRGIDPKIFITILGGGGLGLLIREYDIGILIFKLKNIQRLLKAIPGVFHFKWKSWKRRNIK